MDEHLIQWNYEKRLNNCSNDVEHLEDCDGNCGQHKATKGQVDLHNEVAIWSAANRPIVGLPAVIANNIPVSGFPVEILNVEKKLIFLIRFLAEKGIIDEKEYVEYYKIEMAKFLKEAREETEREEAKASIVMPNIADIRRLKGNGHA